MESVEREGVVRNGRSVNLYCNPGNAGSAKIRDSERVQFGYDAEHWEGGASL